MNATRCLPAAAVALLLLSGCAAQNAQPTSAAAASTVNPAEADFVTNAYQVIEFDRQEGTLAQTQARNPQVKALAQQLTNEANDFAARLGPVAAAAGIQPPTVLRRDLRIRLGHMQLQQGLDFDRVYLADQIASHEEALRSAEAMNGAQVSPQFAALSQQGNELLRQNLAKLYALQRQMGPPRG